MIRAEHLRFSRMTVENTKRHPVLSTGYSLHRMSAQNIYMHIKLHILQQSFVFSWLFGTGTAVDKAGIWVTCRFGSTTRLVHVVPDTCRSGEWNFLSAWHFFISSVAAVCISPAYASSRLVALNAKHGLFVNNSFEMHFHISIHLEDSHVYSETILCTCKVSMIANNMFR